MEDSLRGKAKRKRGSSRSGLDKGIDHKIVHFK